MALMYSRQNALDEVSSTLCGRCYQADADAEVDKPGSVIWET